MVSMLWVSARAHLACARGISCCISCRGSNMSEVRGGGKRGRGGKGMCKVGGRRVSLIREGGQKVMGRLGCMCAKDKFRCATVIATNMLVLAFPWGVSVLD